MLTHAPIIAHKSPRGDNCDPYTEHYLGISIFFCLYEADTTSRRTGWGNRKGEGMKDFALRALVWAQTRQAIARLRTEEDGMTTAEYAIGTLAAAAFAGLLMAVIKGGGIKSALTAIIKQALSI